MRGLPAVFCVHALLLLLPGIYKNGIVIQSICGKYLKIHLKIVIVYRKSKKGLTSGWYNGILVLPKEGVLFLVKFKRDQRSRS